MLRQLITPVLSALLMLVMAFLLSVIYLTNQMDANVAQQELRLLKAELASRLKTLEQLAQDVGSWDDAYIKGVQAFDSNWLDLSIGDIVTSITDLDAILLIGPNGQISYQRYSETLPSLDKDTLRQLQSEIKLKINAKVKSAQTVGGYLAASGQTVLFGTSTVWPVRHDLLEIAQQTDGRSVFVYMERLDAHKLEAIQEKLDLNPLRLIRESADDGKSWVPIRNDVGLTWQPEAPGAAFLRSMTIPMLTFVALLTLIFLFFWRRASAVIRLYELAENTRSVFLSAVGHELKTPLHTIESGSELLRQGEMTTSQRSYLENISNAGHELSAKLNQVIEYTRLGSSKLEIEVVLLDVRELLEEVLANKLRGIKGNKMSVALRIPPDLITKVAGDRKKLGQTFDMLLTYILQSIEYGEVMIELTIVSSEKAQDIRYRLTITAKDQNNGRLFADKALLMEDFISPKGDGSFKWGLSTAQHILRAMKGDVGISRSEDGHGQLWAEFPLGYHSVSAPNFALPSVQGKQALIVDGGTFDSHVLAELLAAIGFTTQIKQDQAGAEEAIDERRQANKPFELIFISDFIGSASGLNVARRLMVKTGPQDANFVLMSNDTSTCDTSILQNAGFAALIPRPIFLRNLRRIVADLFEPNLVGGLDGSAKISLDDEAGLAGLSVLIVEDNFVSRALLKKIVESWGCLVSVAENGKQAVEVAGRRDFDCILMDFNMPEMNGAAATHSIRDMGQSIPIIFLSAASDQHDIDQCKDAGMTDFISKPVAPLVLKKQLVKWVLQA